MAESEKRDRRCKGLEWIIFESCCTSKEQMGIYRFGCVFFFFFRMDVLSQNIPLQKKSNLIFCNIFGSAVIGVIFFTAFVLRNRK